MKFITILFLCFFAFAQPVQPWQNKGENRSALAVRGYIDKARAADDVRSVVVRVDSARVDGIAIVTVTVFTNDSANVPISVMLDFKSLSDSSVQITDTTYSKEIVK